MSENLAEIIKPDDVPDAPPVNQLTPDAVATPIDTPAPAEPDYNELLNEYDAATQTPPPDPAHVDAALDELLASFGDDTAIKQQNAAVDALRNEVSSLRAQEQARIDQADFERACSDLQRQCGPNVDDHYAERELKAALVDRPELLQVWRNRSVTPDQIQAADREFRQLESQYNRVQLAPNSPQKQQALAQMQARGYELGLLMNTPKIISQLRRQVIDRAAKAPLPIDPDATQARMEVAAAVRGASTKVPAEPSPNFGTMTDNELRNYTKQFGF